MNAATTERTDAIVIGAGAAGLAAARTLADAGVAVRVLEAGSDVGGVIGAETIDGFHVDWGPNSLRGKGAEALELADAVGLAGERIAASAEARRRYVLHPTRRNLVPVSAGPGILLSPLLGWHTKWRLLSEIFRTGHPSTGDESVAAFATRRISREFADRLLGPLVSGIYAGDIDRLSVRALFPAMVALEAQYGGLMRGAIARGLSRKPSKSAGAGPVSGSPSGIYSYRHGVKQFMDALAASLPPDVLHVNHRVDALASDATTGGFRLTVSRTNDDGSAAEPTIWAARAVIVTTPAFVTAKLIAEFDAECSAALAAIQYASVACVALGFRRDAVGRALDGFGFLIPPIAGLQTLGSLWSSTLFPNRAPDGHVLLTNFVGGANHPEVVQRDADEVVRQTLDDLRGPLAITESPVMAAVKRWKAAIPQYEIGHLDRVANVDRLEARLPGLRIAGNFRGGAAVPDVIRNGIAHARAIAEFLAANRGVER